MKDHWSGASVCTKPLREVRARFHPAVERDFGGVLVEAWADDSAYFAAMRAALDGAEVEVETTVRFHLREKGQGPE